MKIAISLDDVIRAKSQSILKAYKKLNDDFEVESVELSNNNFKELLKIYNEQGLGDCSCECNFADYIESVDNEDEPTMFLVRI